eukprot:2272797-Rhodomonas_salina.1
MELNETADIMAKAGAALEMDSNWHETDYEGLVYQDVTEDDEFMQVQGVCDFDVASEARTGSPVPGTT